MEAYLDTETFSPNVWTSWSTKIDKHTEILYQTCTLLNQACLYEVLL